MQILFKQSDIRYTNRYSISVLCKVIYSMHCSVTDNYLIKLIDTG